MDRTRFWLVSAMIAGLLAAPMTGCADDPEPPETEEEEEDPRPDLSLIEPGTLTVGSNIPFAPFEQGDPPDYEGFDIDLINEVAEKLDLETDIEPTPFDVILAGGEDRFDLAISAVEITQKRERRVDFSEPYYMTTLGLLVGAESEIGSVMDLRRNSVVGAEVGTLGARYASEDLDGAKVRALPSADDAFNALFNDQVDAVIADGTAAQDAASDREGLEVAETFAAGERYGIVVPESNASLLRAVNEALREIKSEGGIDELYEEYFGIEAPDELTNDRRGEP